MSFTSSSDHHCSLRYSIVMLNNYYIIIVNILSTIRTMYFPVEQCFIIIIKFVKNIIFCGQLLFSFIFIYNRKNRREKIIVTTMSDGCGKKVLGILNLMILIGFFHGLFSLLLFKTRCGWSIISPWPFFLKVLGP